jgi:hypothetical protein
MNIIELRREIEALRLDSAPVDGCPASRLEDLCKAFLACEKNLKEYNRSSGGADDDLRADWVIEMQTIIMARAATTPAATLSDVLYKLAMWRWDAPDLDDEMGVQRYDAMALSAFRDLARILKNDAVLQPGDVGALRYPSQPQQTDLCRAVPFEGQKESAPGRQLMPNSPKAASPGRLRTRP